MKTRNIIEGLTLLQNYRNKPDGYDTGADHETIYAYATDRPLNKIDLKRMLELGWVQKHEGRNYDNDMTPAEYRMEEAWIAYV